MIVLAGILFFMPNSPRAQPQLVYTGHSTILPYESGSFGDIVGDICSTPEGGASVHSNPGEGGYRLEFNRFNSDAVAIAQNQIATDGLSYYAPAIAWDGRNFGVAFSTLTQGQFMIFANNGAVAVAPFALPNIPLGGRTAAFRVIWIGNAYAVFGSWLEKQYPWQDPTSGNFYNHLYYWLIQPDGQVIHFKELQFLAPITYPGIEGMEKTYYDVAWTGAAFFVAYFSESLTGPPLAIYYRMYDLAGNQVRAETRGFAGATAMGPMLASSGQTIGLVGMKSVNMVGNFMYFRVFDANGNPLAPEVQVNSSVLAVSPIISWQGNHFATAYSALYDMGQLQYGIFINAFNAVGDRLVPEYVLKDEFGVALTGTAAIQFDLQMTGNGIVGLGKAQWSASGYLITVKPLVFSFRGTAIDPARILDHLLGIQPLTPAELARADVNGDGEIDIADALLARQ